MAIVTIDELKAKRTEQVNKAISDVLEQCVDLDQTAYQLAKKQAKALEDAIGTDVTTLTILVKGRPYQLELWHTEVSNCIFVMLEELQKLSTELDGGERHE